MALKVQPPPARVGRADLLRAIYSRTQSDANVVAGALGFEYAPEASVGQGPSKVGKGGGRRKLTGVKDPLAGAKRLPLRCPELLVCTELTQGIEVAGEAAKSLQALGLLTADQLDAQFDASLAPKPAWRPIWPRLAQVQGLLDRMRKAHLSPWVDWPAVVNKLARLQPLAPLPHTHTGQVAGHFVVLCDTSPAMRALEADWRHLLAQVIRLRGDLGLEVWKLPEGPAGRWLAVGGDYHPQAWTEDTVVLVISDLGRALTGAEGLQAQWHDALARWSAEAFNITLLHPGSREEQPSNMPAGCDAVPWDDVPHHADDDEAALVEAMMQALSVAITIELPLVRACRRSLFPQAGVRLELLVWVHPDLRPGYPVKTWRDGCQAHHGHALANAAAWSAERLEQLAGVLATEHAGKSAAQRDEELLLLAPPLLLRSAAEQRGVWLAKVACASRRAEQLAVHFLSSVGQTQASLASSAVASGAAYAGQRVQRMPLLVRGQFAGQAEQWAAAHLVWQAQHGQPVVAPDGISLGLLDALLDTTQAHTRRVAVVQRGMSLWLVLVDAEPAGQVYFDGHIRLPRVDVAVDGERCHHYLHSRWNAPICLAQWIEQAPREVTLAWRGGAVCIWPVVRPFGAHGWHSHGNVPEVVAPPLSGVEPALKAQTWDLNTGSLGAAIDTQGGGLTFTYSGRVLDGDGARYRSSRSAIGVELTRRLDRVGVYAELSLVLQGSRHGMGDHVSHALTQRLRYIPPGSFLMGSPPDENGRHRDEGPQHPVTITRGLWLADCACTQALWGALMPGMNPSYFKGSPDLPVEGVSWDVAQKFLQRLNALLPEGCVAELPLEAEWEYACRAGTDTAFSFGESILPEQVNYDIGPYAGAGRGDHREQTVAVRSLPANPWGLHEMHGNLWEWCADAPRRYLDRAESDPTGGGVTRVLRGGSWHNRANWARSACRASLDRGVRSRELGFRFLLRSTGPAGPGGPSASPAAAELPQVTDAGRASGASSTKFGQPTIRQVPTSNPKSARPSRPPRKA